jgi:transposase
MGLDFESYFEIKFTKMKSEDLQKLVLSKYKKGESSTKIFEDLNGFVSSRTIRRWCQMMSETGSISLSHSPGRPRIIRTKGMIQKVKNRMKRKKRVSIRKFANELDISNSSVVRIWKQDLGYRSYKKRVEPALTDLEKTKRMKFANWVRHNFRKEDTLRILFSDEKMFDIDGIYNAQNDRIWAVDREDADKKGGIKQKRKFPQKVMVWLGACSEGLTPLIILDGGTVDHQRYIDEVLPVALEYGNKTFGDKWTFQQDGAKPHTHVTTQKWCHDHFSFFIDKDHWPPNSPDLNPLDYSIWDEFGQQINWTNVKSKKTLIDELKRAVKRIRDSVVVESCKSWTNRLYRLSMNNGSYLQ